MPLALPFRLTLPLLLVAALLAGLPVALGATPARAASACTDATGPNAAYTTRVCLTAPDGALSGGVPLSATVAVYPATGATPPTVRKVVFFYGEEYLLTDFDAEPASVPADYRMTWRTARSAAPSGTLLAKVRFSDDFAVDAALPVALSDAATAAPNTRRFEVRRGSTPAPGARYRVVAVGDAVDGSAREVALADQIASWSPNLMTYLGDVYERGSAYEFDNWYARPDGFGRFRAITNPTVGNHEYLTAGGAGYADYWDNVPRYYSYDVAGWHVVAIDSSRELDQLRPGTAQYEWLAADLGANRSRCTMVYLHHPRYSVAPAGDRGGMAAMWSLLAARRVTLAVAGHAHQYERWSALDGAGNPDARGVTQLIAGAGGHEPATALLTDPRLATSSTEAGALRLDLGSADAEFAYVTATGQVRDAGSIGCKSTGDPLPPTTPTGLLVSPTSDTTARLSWNPSTDQYSSVAGYTVRRNGIVVARLDGATTTYVDPGLVSGQTYTWTVDAYDTSDNYSPQSAAAVTTMPAPAPVLVSSRTLLRALPARPETGRGYSRTKFRTWVDADGDRCNTRSEVLLSEAMKPPTLLPACRITGGKWFSRYDGIGTTNRARLGIEHLVPLREVWQAGGKRWTALTRQRFANDLTYRPTLNVATDSVLAARGAAEPQRWLPPRSAARCTYLAQWVAVKWRWRLALDRPERAFLSRRLSRCGWPAVEQPTRAAVARW